MRFFPISSFVYSLKSRILLLTAVTLFAISIPCLGNAAAYYYNGGPVLTGTVNVYWIWYGNWKQSDLSVPTSTPGILNALVWNLTGSAYWNVLSQYGQLGNSNASNSILNSSRYIYAPFVGYPYGSTVTDANLQSLITTEIQNGTFPSDPNGIYVVIDSADVTQFGAGGRQDCTTTPGSGVSYHSHFNLNGTNIIYANILDPTTQACGNSLLAKMTSVPNGNKSGDFMASMLAHELAEAITNPLINTNSAWMYNGDEMADLCELDAPGGSKANVQLGAYTFYLQSLAQVTPTASTTSFAPNGQGIAAPNGCTFSSPVTWVPVYRFSSTRTYLTMNFQGGVNTGLGYNGLGFYVLSDNTISGTQPLYSCYWPAAKKDFVVNDPNCWGQTIKGVLGFVFSTQVTTTKPLYAVYNSQTGDLTLATDYQAFLSRGYILDSGILGYTFGP